MSELYRGTTVRAKVHILKSWIGSWEAVADGTKGFEYRADDRGGFEYGDVLELRQWDQFKAELTGSVLRCRVTYVLEAHQPFEPVNPPAGMVILGIGDGDVVTS